MMDVDMEPSSPVQVTGAKRRREDEDCDAHSDFAEDRTVASLPRRAKRPALDPSLATQTASLSLATPPLSPFSLHIRASFRPYWFPDGDVLLVVADHMFKLPRAILSCSEIFEDMFALADPCAGMGVGGSEEEMFEGCPVVHLDDRPGDWMVLLRWIDNPEQFWEDEVPYETLAGALRLSTKYEIASLREKAVRAVIKIWPREDRMRRLDTTAFNSHRVDAIALARQCDLPEILPSIFYSFAIEYQSFPSLSPTLDPWDAQRILSAVSALQDFLDRATSYVRNNIGSDRCPGPSIHWATELERDVVINGSGSRVKQKHWLLRLAKHAYNRQEIDALDACEECRVGYYRFLSDGLLRKLEVEMPAWFGL
ncbi:unnamed protein product [Peniophora sp. CBMAI 1063]|nr:unnamed protein product [Peniophora sp. CBMAI 1063]